MTVPMDLQRASEEFEEFLVEARDISGLATRHQAFTMVQAVLFVFRRRLDVRDGLRFAEILPPVLRAIFVSHWNIDELKPAFGSRECLTAEVLGFRSNHNVSPYSAISDVARALRKCVDEKNLERVLASLPDGAAAFWAVDAEAASAPAQALPGK